MITDSFNSVVVQINESLAYLRQNLCPIVAMVVLIVYVIKPKGEYDQTTYIILSLYHRTKSANERMKLTKKLRFLFPPNTVLDALKNARERTDNTNKASNNNGNLTLQQRNEELRKVRSRQQAVATQEMKEGEERRKRKAKEEQQRKNKSALPPPKPGTRLGRRDDGFNPMQP